jgi:hypothetical protein
MVRDAATGALELQPERWHDRLWSRIRAASIDRRLARGLAPESSRTLASRAETLVDPATREAIARDVEHLLSRRDRISAGIRPIRPREVRVGPAGEELHRVLDLLRTPYPAPARGVAMLTVLLTDGTGPLYNPRSDIDLVAAVRAARRQLEPASAMPMSP